MLPPVPIAYVDGRRQIVVVDRRGRAHPQTGGGGLMWAKWGHHEPGDVHSWPTWSPDGARLAAFRIARSGESSRVWVTDVAGVRGAEVAMMGDRVPIYLQWSLDGDRLAVLSQDDNHLVLQVADPVGDGADHDLLRGSPLFFTWVRGGRIAAFVGEGTPNEPHLAIVTPEGARHDLVGAPGNFCAPVRTEGGVAYVAQVRQSVAVLVSSLDGSRVRELESVDGLVSLLGSPDGRHLARAISPDGSGTPYGQLELIDVQTAERTPVTDRSCIAYFWLPGGDGLVVAHAHDDRKAVRWVRVMLDGTEHELLDLVPSRDSRVYLRFFEQYGPSHPVIDPTGTHLVLCGALPGDSGSVSRVILVPLDGSPAEEVGEGLFASFAPLRSPEP